MPFGLLGKENIKSIFLPIIIQEIKDASSWFISNMTSEGFIYKNIKIENFPKNGEFNLVKMNQKGI